MHNNEIIQKLDKLLSEVKEVKDEIDFTIDQINDAESQADSSKDRAECLEDEIRELISDVKASPYMSAGIDEDKLNQLFEFRELVMDCVGKITNHRSASINHVIREDLIDESK